MHEGDPLTLSGLRSVQCSLPRLDSIFLLSTQYFIKTELYSSHSLLTETQVFSSLLFQTSVSPVSPYKYLPAQTVFLEAEFLSLQKFPQICKWVCDLLKQYLIAVSFVLPRSIIKHLSASVRFIYSFIYLKMMCIYFHFCFLQFSSSSSQPEHGLISTTNLIILKVVKYAINMRFCFFIKFFTLLVGMQTSTAAVENSVEIP